MHPPRWRPAISLSARARFGMDRFLVRKRPLDEEGGSPAKAARPAPAPEVGVPEAAADLISSLQDESWRSALKAEVGKAYFNDLATAVARERASKTIFPPKADVFTAFNLTPLPSVRVVIIGQDPYHGPGQAHGLSFSVRRGIALPGSLKNIFTELEADIPGFKRPAHGDLSAWARQGVLMLNASRAWHHPVPFPPHMPRRSTRAVRGSPTLSLTCAGGAAMHALTAGWVLLRAWQ
jgi:hypothetical protein